MLRSIGHHLVAEGHEITVLTAQPAMNTWTAQKRMPWREKLDGLLVLRCRLLPIRFDAGLTMRTLNMFIFVARAFWPMKVATNLDPSAATRRRSAQRAGRGANSEPQLCSGKHKTQSERSEAALCSADRC